MYVKAIEATVIEYPYSINKLKSDNPDTSFPTAPPLELLNEWGVYLVVAVGQPVYDAATQKITEIDPVWTGTRWEQVFEVTNLTVSEIAAARQASMPRKITREQTRLALNDLVAPNNANMLDVVESLIPTLSRVAQIKWEDGGVLHIDNEFVNEMQALLGWTDTQKEDFFIAAGAK